MPMPQASSAKTCRWYKWYLESSVGTSDPSTELGCSMSRRLCETWEVRSWNPDALVRGCPGKLISRKKSRDFRSQLFAVLAHDNPWKSVRIRGQAVCFALFCRLILDYLDLLQRDRIGTTPAVDVASNFHKLTDIRQ